MERNKPDFFQLSSRDYLLKNLKGKIKSVKESYFLIEGEDEFPEDMWKFKKGKEYPKLETDTYYEFDENRNLLVERTSQWMYDPNTDSDDKFYVSDNETNYIYGNNNLVVEVNGFYSRDQRHVYTKSLKLYNSNQDLTETLYGENNVSRSIDFDLKTTKKFIYSDEGNLILKMDYWSEKNITHYIYDSRGNLSEEIKCSLQGMIVIRYIYEYDVNNNLIIKKTNYGIIDKYEYDEKGRILKKSSENSQFTNYYENDKLKKRVLENINFDGVKTKIQIKMFNLRGNVSEIISFKNEKVESKTIYKYDLRDNLVEKSQLDHNNVESFKIEFIFDSNDFLIQQINHSKKKTESYIFIYDFNDNLIELKVHEIEINDPNIFSFTSKLNINKKYVLNSITHWKIEYFN